MQIGGHGHVDPVERAIDRAPEDPLAQLVATVENAFDLGVDLRHGALSSRLSRPVDSTRPLFAERNIASTTSTERSPTLASPQFSTSLPRQRSTKRLTGSTQS